MEWLADFAVEEPLALLEDEQAAYAARHLPETQGWELFLELEPVASVQAVLDTVIRAEPAQELPLCVAYFGYDYLASLAGVQTLGERTLGLPACWLARPGLYLRWEEGRARCWGSSPSALSRLRERAERSTSAPGQPAPPTQLRCNLSFEQYEPLFEAAIEAIRQGETYQIKLSQRYGFACQESPLTIFRRMMQRSPMPEAALLVCPDFALVSASPESVMATDGRRLRTRPIGGTWEKREGEDEAGLLEAFLANEKERSEHNMLVDLERNDLGRVCEMGSVTLARYGEIESYAHLWHLVSTIEGCLRESLRVGEVLAAMLPGGSITGCPKIRTMQLIDAFEPVAREFYTGSFGTIAADGSLRFNLLIRTLCLQAGQASLQAGGGIVYDSDAAYEYRENRLKARALLEAAGVPWEQLP